MNTSKQLVTYLAVAFGHWARGETAAEAIDNCRKSGAKKRDRTILYRNEREQLSQSLPFVSDDGMMHYHGKLERIITLPY